MHLICLSSIYFTSLRYPKFSCASFFGNVCSTRISYLFIVFECSFQLNTVSYVHHNVAFFLWLSQNCKYRNLPNIYELNDMNSLYDVLTNVDQVATLVLCLKCERRICWLYNNKTGYGKCFYFLICLSTFNEHDQYQVYFYSIIVIKPFTRKVHVLV